MRGESKKLRVVLDTNILISALGHGSGGVRKIWDLVEEGRFEAVVSPFILEEFERNLPRKAAFTREESAEMAAYVQDCVEVVEPRARVSIIRAKESDNRILECALEAEVDAIVTGDLKHIRPLGRFQGMDILTPREFLDRYFQGV